MNQLLRLLLVASALLPCLGFRSPAGVRPRFPSAMAAFKGTGIPQSLQLSRMQPLVSPLLGAAGRGAAQAMAAVQQAAREPEIRLAVGTKVLARPMLNAASRAMKKMRKTFGYRADTPCLLDDAPRYADSLGDLLLLNGALRCASSAAYPASTVSSVLPAMTKLSYIAYAASAAASLKEQMFARQPYTVDKLTSLFIWGTASLAAADVLSSSTKLSVSKTLALGGFSGTLMSLFAKDLSNNIFGGATVILNGRFKPGDVVSFKVSGSEFIGEVISIGLTQTVMRSSKDRKLSYIPNGLLAQTPVTHIGHPKRGF
jgi:hypothetical protein